MAACGDAHVDAPVSGVRGALGDVGNNAGFETADKVIDFSFPRDHGPHPPFRSEWWYLTAVLATADGRRFGTQFTLFRQGLAPQPPVAVPLSGASAWRTGQIYMAHVALSDIAAGRHVHAERFARGHPSLAGAAPSPFAAYMEDWRLASAAQDFWPLQLETRTADFAVALELDRTKPIVLQGDRGLSRKGPDNASYYYSIPRIRAQGTVVVDAARYAVTGSAWLDREWSTSVLAAEYAGWDWFALHLADGRDLMVFSLRAAESGQPGYGAGKLVGADGRGVTLEGADFSLIPADTWRGWPIRWELVLHGDPPERFAVAAAFNDQVMDTSVRYWEGVVDVLDTDGRPAGSGYMELTGYGER